MDNNKSTIDTILKLFHRFENLISIILAVLIVGILGVALVRIAVSSYILIFSNILTPTEIAYEHFNDIFGKIMTLIITIEFMNSILSVLKTGDLKGLVLDVTLITGLAIARKLIIFDYSSTEPMAIIAMGVVLTAVGIFYFLIRINTLSKYLSRKEEVKK